MQIVFVSRELHPLGGGGIGVQISSACAVLADVADVTVVTSSVLEPAYRRLEAAGELGHLARARVAFVEEPAPDEAGTFYGTTHLYSARVWERLKELYPDGGPDLIEFPDFAGEGMVTLQARRAHVPLLRHTGVAVRLHTSAEMCSILDGFIGEDFGTRMIVAAERYALRHADRLIAPGEDVLETYVSFYGPQADGGDVDGARHAALAPSVEIAPAVLVDPPPPAPAPPIGDGLRFLYLGRLERRKGVQDLLRAFTALDDGDWRLTLVGGDTDTAPSRTSMRGLLGLMAGGDPRIEFRDELSADGVRDLIDEHHVVIAPSRWECWPSAVLEGLGRNRPVLATPTGGMPEMLVDYGSGWLTGGVGEMALADAVENLLSSPEMVEDAIEAGAPRRAHDRLNDPERLRDSYLELAAAIGGPEPAPPTVTPQPSALVSVVIPYFELEDFVEDAVRSVFDQDYERLEVIVVNDGSLRREDAILEELAERFPITLLTTENGGLGRARNFGILNSLGDYVLPMDADNLLDPTFVSRCVEVLEREPDLVYVTTWSQYIDEGGSAVEGPENGFQPIGNSSAAVMADNVAGDATAVIRREIFDSHRYATDVASYEDWQLYRELHCDGLFGTVIPERLLIYRVRADSMVREFGLAHHHRIFDEMRARTRAREVDWLCTSTPIPTS